MTSIGSIADNSPYSLLGTAQKKEKKEFSLTDTFLKSEGVEIEKDGEKQQASSPLGITVKQLSPEEERRLEQLRDMLDGILMDMGDTPTESQKRRIREIEQEMEKLTGVKSRIKLSDGVTAMKKAKLKEGDEDEEEETANRMNKRHGFALMEHLSKRGMPESPTTPGPGIMNAWQNMAMNAYAQQQSFGQLGNDLDSMSNTPSAGAISGASSQISQGVKGLASLLNSKA